MQEHFNEKYVESERFPKATFKGHVANWSGLELSSRATPVTVAGELTIHGVTRTIEAQGTLTATGPNGIHGESVFTVEVADYDIKIPGAVRDNIAKTIQITVKMDYEKMD